MKKPLTEEERKLIIKMAAAQILGVIKTNDSKKTKLIKKHIIEALYLFGITESDIYDMRDVQRRICDETYQTAGALMHRSWR